LLVTFIPGLLMLATFGLERLESGLARDTVSASDVAEFLEHAHADDVLTLAQEGMPKALNGMQRRLQQRDCELESAPPYVIEDDWPNLPTPLYLDNPGNTEFRQYRHANRV